MKLVFVKAHGKMKSLLKIILLKLVFVKVIWKLVFVELIIVALSTKSSHYSQLRIRVGTCRN